MHCDTRISYPQVSDIFIASKSRAQSAYLSPHRLSCPPHTTAGIGINTSEGKRQTAQFPYPWNDPQWRDQGPRNKQPSPATCVRACKDRIAQLT